MALLIHPWGVVTDAAEKRDLLEYYGSRYDRYLIMMSLAIDGIVQCQLGEAEKAWEILERFLEWFRPPYLQSSESPWNECMSFLTGLGGFLQLFIYGFAGLRWEEDVLVIEPCLPPKLPRLELKGISIAGASCDILVSREGVRIREKGLPIRVVGTPRLED